MDSGTLKRFTLLIFCLTGFISWAAADIALPYYTTQTLTFSLERDTTITRRVITTSATEYLISVLPELPEPNSSIVKLAMAYPTNGTHDYWWPKRGEGQYDGSTTDVLLNGKLVMKGEPKGRSFCCGLTLEIFYKYLVSHPQLADRIAEDKFSDFKSLWFCREINSPGPAEAMETYNVGTRVSNPEDALPGDFVQLWRTNRSGHSVIFVNWLRGDKDERIGIQYWSTQIATKGIGFKSELFGQVPGLALNIEDKLSIARPAISN